MPGPGAAGDLDVWLAACRGTVALERTGPVFHEPARLSSFLGKPPGLALERFLVSALRARFLRVRHARAVDDPEWRPAGFCTVWVDDDGNVVDIEVWT